MSLSDNMQASNYYSYTKQDSTAKLMDPVLWHGLWFNRERGWGTVSRMVINGKSKLDPLQVWSTHV